MPDAERPPCASRRRNVLPAAGGVSAGLCAAHAARPTLPDASDDVAREQVIAAATANRR